MSALSHANDWNAALELFSAAHEDPQVLEHPQVLEKGLIALTMALNKAGTMVDMLTVVHFMLEHQIKVSVSCWMCKVLLSQILYAVIKHTV